MAATGLPRARADQQHRRQHGCCIACELLECFSPALIVV
jgi:hypothetical protein